MATVNINGNYNISNGTRNDNDRIILQKELGILILLKYKSSSFCNIEYFVSQYFICCNIYFDCFLSIPLNPVATIYFSELAGLLVTGIMIYT